MARTKDSDAKGLRAERNKMSRQTRKSKKDCKKDRLPPAKIKWPTWCVQHSPTPSKLMVCTKCQAPAWAPSRDGVHTHPGCGGRLRALTAEEKMQARAALVEFIGDGKPPSI